MSFPFPENHTSAAASPASRINVVLFDYGMVLSAPPDPVAWAKMCSITGLDDDRLHASYWEFRHDYDRGALTGLAYWHAVAAHAGITLDDAQITALFLIDVDLWTQPNLPMVEWAGRLQRAGIRTAILSNIGDRIAEGIVAKLPWLSRFELCVWSHALFMAKPEPAIYVKTAEALNTPLANILFIDDRKENVEAAAALGVQAIHYTSHVSFDREMRACGLASLLDTGIADGPEGSLSATLAREPQPAAK
ncbi:MAG TPA: HAD family phosphatase [Acidobacteriaceae bacterium]